MGGILCSGILDGGKKALSVSNMLFIEYFAHFLPLQAQTGWFSFDVMAIGKCDGKVPIFWFSAPCTCGVRTTSPGVQFIYPKCGVRNLRQGTLHQTCSRWCKYRTRSKVHIIRLTFTIIIARIPRQTILLGTRSITYLYKRH